MTKNTTSAVICTFERRYDPKEGELNITACVAGEDNAAVQLTITDTEGSAYVVLLEGQVRALVHLLSLRLSNNISATGAPLNLRILRDGTVEKI